LVSGCGSRGAGREAQAALRLGHVAIARQARKVWLNGDYSVGDRRFPRQSIEQITAGRGRASFRGGAGQARAAFVPEQTPVAWF